MFFSQKFILHPTISLNGHRYEKNMQHTNGHIFRFSVQKRSTLRFYLSPCDNSTPVGIFF